MSFTPFNFDKRKKEFINSIIIFVYDCLPRWRNSNNWSNNENEKKLNSDLVKSLTGYARIAEIGVNFFSEEPQGKVHTVDIVACHYDKNIENFSDAIIVFECKRLTKTIGEERIDEYVTGHEKTGGGIQRFKLEVHGKEHEIVGMIGYIQSGTCPEWLETINNYIGNLCGKPDENGLHWNKNELLNTIEHDEGNSKYHGKSIHPRKTRPDITIHHLWVNMQHLNFV